MFMTGFGGDTFHGGIWIHIVHFNGEARLPDMTRFILLMIICAIPASPQILYKFA